MCQCLHPNDDYRGSWNMSCLKDTYIQHHEQKIMERHFIHVITCVGASRVNIFKNKIDIYLRRAGYT